MHSVVGPSHLCGLEASHTSLERCSVSGSMPILARPRGFPFGTPHVMGFPAAGTVTPLFAQVYRCAAATTSGDGRSTGQGNRGS